MLVESTFGVAAVGLDIEDATAIGQVCEHLRFPTPVVVPEIGSLHADFARAACSVLFVTTQQLEPVLSYAAQLEERPRIVLISQDCTPRAAFSYAQRGVDALLEKPLQAVHLLECLDDMLNGPTTLQRVAASQLGRYGLKDAQQFVRRAMLQEALDRTGGNRHATARLLRVDRRAVQLALKELGTDAGPNLSSPPSRVPSAQPLRWSAGRADLRALVKARVHRADDVILWRELPQQSPEYIHGVFQRFAELSRGEPLRLVVDLTEAGRPSVEVRDCLRAELAQLTPPDRVAVYPGPSEQIGLVAKFVISRSKSGNMTLHSSLESAFRAASDTKLRAV